MNTKVRKAINEFANRIKIKIGDEIELMLVYGSALTKRYWEGMSDIDALIVSPKRGAYDKIPDMIKSLTFKQTLVQNTGWLFLCFLKAPHGLRGF